MPQTVGEKPAARRDHRIMMLLEDQRLGLGEAAVMTGADVLIGIIGFNFFDRLARLG